jgi:nickel-dependent lactate racemase
MKERYHLDLSRDKKEFFALPEGWAVSHFVESKEAGSLPSVSQLTLEALIHPKGVPPLKELAAGAKRVAVIVDDATRPTPVAEILSVLLPQLAQAGVSRENITIVVALGTHVPMKKEEIEARLGRDVAASYRIVQHDAWQGDLVQVLIPDDERVLKINPEVACADVKIGISSILPHPMAGYGGGPKIVMPGVSNFEFIRNHHMKHTIHPRAVAGITKGNPFYEDCMRAAQSVGLTFSINCVYNQRAELIHILGGSLEKAFGAAVDICFEELGARFDEKVDITIASTYPHTHAHQFCKGLSATDIVTKETGAILLMAPTVTPMSEEFITSFDVIRERSHDRSAQYVTEAMSKGMPFLPDKPVEFNMAMKCLIIRPRIRTIFVSPMASRAQAAAMGLEHAPSLEEGLGLLEKAYPKARVAIFPSGGLIVPITAWEQ